MLLDSPEMAQSSRGGRRTGPSRQGKPANGPAQARSGEGRPPDGAGRGTRGAGGRQRTGQASRARDARATGVTAAGASRDPRAAAAAQARRGGSSASRRTAGAVGETRAGGDREAPSAPVAKPRGAGTRADGAPARPRASSHAPDPVRDTRDLGAGIAAASGARAARAVVAAPLAVALAGVVLLALGTVAVGAVLLVLGAGVATASRRLGSPARLAARVGGRSADPVTDAGIVSVVDGLCVVLGLRAPELRLLDDPAANAIVLGPDASSAVLVVTTGLVAMLDRIELEGLVAHELAHVRRGDLERASLATRGLGLVALFGSSAGRSVRRLAGPERESLADLRAVSATRYPPGLSSALEKLSGAPGVRPAGLDTVTARLTSALWCAQLDEALDGTARRGVLDVGERAAALREL